MPLLVLWSTTNIKTGCRNTLKAGSVPLLQCTQRGSLHILLYNYCDSYCDKLQFPSNTEKNASLGYGYFFLNKGVQNDRYQGSDRIQHAQIIFLFFKVKFTLLWWHRWKSTLLLFHFAEKGSNASFHQADYLENTNHCNYSNWPCVTIQPRELMKENHRVGMVGRYLDEHFKVTVHGTTLEKQVISP